MLLTASTDLKEFISSYTKQKEIFDLQERHDDNMKVNTNKNFFSDNYIVDIFMFISAVISVLATTLTVYLLCKHKNTQSANNKFGFTPSQRNRHTNSTNQF